MQNEDMYNEELARHLCDAIKKMTSKEGCLENFESYLSRHFVKWYEKFANTPEGLITEFEHFADID